MLYLLYRSNHSELSYRDGQQPIVHLEADVEQVIAWAEARELRWAFTSSNAGSNYFIDCSDVSQLGNLDWAAIKADNWAGRKEGKQAEFLVESAFPWELISRIGVYSQAIANQVKEMMPTTGHRPALVVKRDWYY
jgi:hypothetical protein